MKITVKLFDILIVDDDEENSTIMQVHAFPLDEPISAGTTFEYRGHRYVHYSDVPTGPDSVDLYYVREIKVIEVK